MYIQTYKPDRPEEYAWLGARRFVRDMQREHGSAAWVKTHMVSRQQYLEHGHNYCNRKFQDAI
jgi:actin-related protein